MPGKHIHIHVGTKDGIVGTDNAQRLVEQAIDRLNNLLRGRIYSAKDKAALSSAIDFLQKGSRLLG